MDKLDERTEELRKELALIEEDVVTEGVTLSTLMREGTRVTGQMIGGWHNEDYSLMCALDGAYLAARARNIAK